MKLNIADIIIDAGTQMRAAMCEETVAEYADADLFDTLPPVGVTRAGEKIYLNDGFHRVAAAKKLGRTTIEAHVVDGSLRDAVLAAVGANAVHGLKRSAADKRKAVETLLKDPEWGKWSSRKIATMAAVSPDLVDRMRAAAGGGPTERKVARGPSTFTQTTKPAQAQPDGWDDPEPAEPAAPVKDATGRDVPEHLRGVFTAGVAAFKEWEKFVREAADRLEAFATDAHSKWARAQDFKVHTGNLIESLKFSKPYAVCPKCDGNGCSACRDSGYMNKVVFEALPKERA